MMEEDFYYSRENTIHFVKKIIRKAIIFIFITLSVASFLYITINAYYFADKHQDETIKIIKSPTNDIKIRVQKDVKRVENLDKMIYKNIVGNNDEVFKKKKTKIILNIKPPYVSKIYKTPANCKIKKEVKIVDLNGKKTTNPKIISGTRVQVAAMGSKDAAERYWYYIVKNNANLVKNYDRYITEIDLGQRGVFYRLQIGNFKTQDKAERFCREFVLKNNKDESDCIILD